MPHCVAQPVRRWEQKDAEDTLSICKSRAQGHPPQSRCVLAGSCHTHFCCSVTDPGLAY